MRVKCLNYAGIATLAFCALSFITKDSPLAKKDVMLETLKSVREVFTGKHLFVISIKPNKNKDSASFLAESRDSFMVVNYDNDSSKVILDWTICPNGKCPEAKLYYPGKPGYDQLDSTINTQLKLKAATKDIN